MPFGLFYYLYLPSGAGPRAMSEAQRRTVNRRSSDLFPIGSSKALYLPPSYFVVYKILDSNAPFYAH
jgi:hypothetical protein